MWAESPITTTIETLPISEITFPKVSVCPPKNTFTNLNYDIMMTENMTLDNETRIELIKTLLESLDDENYKQVLKNLSLIQEKNRFYNWYNGYSKLVLPRFSNSWRRQLRINFETVSSKGNFMTKGFGDDFDHKKVPIGEDLRITIHVPKSIKRENVTIFGKIEIEELNINTDNHYSNEGIHFSGYRLDSQGKKEFPFNFTAVQVFDMKREYYLSETDWKDLKMEKMPGFRIDWQYSADTNPERRFFEKEFNPPFEGSHLYSRAFKRFVQKSRNKTIKIKCFFRLVNLLHSKGQIEMRRIWKAVKTTRLELLFHIWKDEKLSGFQQEMCTREQFGM